MDRQRYSFIAHGQMAYCNPVSPAALEACFLPLPLTAGSVVLDIGAGKAAMLVDLVRRFGCRAVAVESAPLFADEAERRVEAEKVAHRITIVRGDAGAYVRSPPPGSFDAVLCIGASHALGGLSGALASARRLLKPGGHAIVGEGYWKRPPCPEYLAALGGASEDEMKTHAGTVEACIDAGFTPLHAAVASDADWDSYEWGYYRNVQEHLRMHPDDPDADAMRKQSAEWLRTFLAWGRDTLGFGLYVLRMPD